MTPEHRHNFERLEAGLRTEVPDRSFDMSVLGTTLPADCGTVGCALGWAPRLVTPAREGESWTDYSQRVFDTTGDEFDWVFCPLWADREPTPQQAADRIRYMLDHGAPETSLLQAQGLAPLSHRSTDT